MCCSRAKGVILGSVLCSIAMVVGFLTATMPRIEFKYDVPAVGMRYTSWRDGLPATALIFGGTWIEANMGQNDGVDYPPHLSLQLSMIISATTALIGILIGMLLIIPQKPNIRALAVLSVFGFVVSLGVNVYFVPMDMTQLAKNIIDAGHIPGCASAAACPPENVTSVTPGFGWAICVAWVSSILLLSLSSTFYETWKALRAGRLSASALVHV